MTTPRMFDQMIEGNGGEVPPNISPNLQIRGEVIFEPLGSGIRVTGRTEKHELLWGLVCSKGMLDQPHASIAIYSALREDVKKSLAARSLPISEPRDSVDAALSAIKAMEAFLNAAKKKITVNEVTPQTSSRAAVIAKSVGDAYQMMTLEVPFVGVRGGSLEPGSQ